MRTLFRILAVVVCLALVGLALVTLADFNAPRLEEALVRRAEDAYGVELEAERTTLSFRHGLLLENVVARTEADGERFQASMDRLVLEHRLWPLLRGEVVVERLLLERPVIEVVSASPGAGGGGATRGEGDPAERPDVASESASSALRLDIGEVVVDDGRLTSTSSRSEGATVMEGFDLVLRDVGTDPEAASLLLGLRGEGWLEMRALSIDGHRLEDIEGALLADRGRFRLEGFEATTASGDMTVKEIEIDLAQSPYRYRLAMDAASIDLGRFLGLPSGLGGARLELQGTGEGPGLAGAVAEVALWLDAGTLPAVSMLSKIDRLLGTELAGAAYEATDCRVSLSGGHLEIDPLELVTEGARVELSGSVAPDGALDLRISVGLPRELFTRDDLSAEVLDALTDRRDQLTVPLRVTGSMKQPRLAPDVEAVRRVTKTLGESVEGRVRAELSSSIRRRIGG